MFVKIAIFQEIQVVLLMRRNLKLDKYRGYMAYTHQTDLSALSCTCTCTCRNLRGKHPMQKQRYYTLDTCTCIRVLAFAGMHACP